MKVFYLRDENNFPKGAVAVSNLQIAFSMCSKKENFSKAKARVILAGRLKKGKTLIVGKSDDFDLKQSLKEMGLLTSAKKQKVDLEKSEFVLKKMLAEELGE